jgi:hypothetical protein
LPGLALITTWDASPLDEDAQELRRSTRNLLDLAERERVALAIFGHDLAQMRELKKASAYCE